MVVVIAFLALNRISTTLYNGVMRYFGDGLLGGLFSLLAVVAVCYTVWKLAELFFGH